MELTFENAIKRLEEITVLLENGQLSLEESLKAYEEGSKLADFCAQKLKEVELKITVLDPSEAN